MAISNERKKELVAQYESWLKNSEAIVLAEYSGMDVPSIDKLRSEMRAAGGEFHVIKNTLARVAFTNAGYEFPAEFFLGSTAIGVAFDDPPVV
ncbi:MAG: 50S ribosomal protein L10, partial [Chloroflexota bacterium]